MREKKNKNITILYRFLAIRCEFYMQQAQFDWPIICVSFYFDRRSNQLYIINGKNKNKKTSKATNKKYRLANKRIAINISKQFTNKCSIAELSIIIYD